jgi:hypothetical protein
MNTDFEAIKSILLEIKSDYIKGFSQNEINENTPITERDIIAEIYCRLKLFCLSKKLYKHCEIKPTTGETDAIDYKLERIDNVILNDIGEKTWVSSAIKLQDRYKKRKIEARFASIPICFFHTAIEAKIQSNVKNAKKDIDSLKNIQNANKNCNCFFVLLNARGKKTDHDKIKEYAKNQKICIIEYSQQTL